ncbi:hypothetical protein GGR51DRAFT_574704 [Nemania sp. FL0031]|nr:hypothetical protein GGR51DRAFT_574704 [Nemania sp. FL0031]
MASPRTPTPCSVNGHRGDGSQKTIQVTKQPSPLALLSPQSSKSASPSSRPLPTCLTASIPLPSRFSPKISGSNTIYKPTEAEKIKSKSIMALRFDRLKAKWQELRARASPAVFRHAGHVFLALVVVAFASVIIGWYCVAKESANHGKIIPVSSTMTPVPLAVPTIMSTVYHETFTFEPTPTMTSTHRATHKATPTGYHHSPLPTHTSSHPRLHSRAYEVDANEDPAKTTSTSTTFSDDIGEVTIVRTVILTVTNVFTYTESKVETVTTTVFVPTCPKSVTTSTIGAGTDTTASPTSTKQRAMTVPTYCPFTGRPNIYTFCGYGYGDEDPISTGAPAVASSSSSRMKNPLSMIRLALTSLWDSVAGVGRVNTEQTKHDHLHENCNCTELYIKLESAMNRVRKQQCILAVQNDGLMQYKKSLDMIRQVLANATAARNASRGLNIHI